MNDAEWNKLIRLCEKLSHPRAEVRTRAALELSHHPHGDIWLDPLTRALEDPEPAVVGAVVDALDRIVAAHPSALRKLMDRVNEAARPPLLGLARYLVHVGTPEAVDAALSIVAEDAAGDENTELLDVLVGAEGLTDQRLEAILDERDRYWISVPELAAEILGRRGIAAGYRTLFGSYGSRSLYDRFIARGSEGIRTLCGAFPDEDDSNPGIAERLAAHRKRTEATIRELAVDPSSRCARTAVEVLGYWDEPRNIEILMRIARDPFRDSVVRRQAIVSLCRIEAPEAIDLLTRTLLDRREVGWLRCECAEALGAIGKPDALHALEWVATNASDEQLRELAREAIEAIRSPMAA